MILGGSTASSFRPIVSINQNLLPFVDKEVSRYKFSPQYFKFKLLKYFQINTFNNSSGIIYLTNFSRLIVNNFLKDKNFFFEIIPHGVSENFKKKISFQKNIGEYSFSNPFKILYVSSLEHYKNHIQLIDAVCQLRNENLPITLDIVGAGKNSVRKLIESKLKKVDKSKKFIFFRGKKNVNELKDFYHRSELFVFCSSCETFGQILLESMSASLPILCSNLTGLHETSKSAAIYFNPLDKKDFYFNLKNIINDKDLREKLSKEALRISEEYTWSICSYNTFKFIEKTYNKFSSK